MSLTDQIKNSEIWQSTESRSAIFVTGILVVIAVFLVSNYYQKTDQVEESNDQALAEITEELGKNGNTTDDGIALGADEERANAYVVEESDTLWSIAESQLGDPYRWTEIKELNKLTSSELEAGQVLLLPTEQEANTIEEKSTDEEIEATNNSETTNEPEENITEKTVETDKDDGEVLAKTSISEIPDTYTVERNDTLWSIAEKLYGDPYKYTEILQANSNLGRLPNGNVLIHRGNVLTIPQL